ncbi:MAG: glycosyltransferase [Chloroflexi bacterium]|nr:glycosyltransferase [Chloroflexota bacterium]
MMKISIITPSYFRVEMIEKAIQSVLGQKYDDFEHIVIDGGSTDGTLKVLSKYPHLKTIVKPDKGLYDAINKGLRMAKGEVIGLLNSDDFYEEGVFQEVSSIFDGDGRIDVVIGQAGIFEAMDSGQILVDQYPPLKEDSLLDRLVFGAPIINAWFFKRTLFDRVGSFDLTYPIGADRDFLLRLYLAGFAPVSVNKTFYHYRKHSGSLTINPGLDAQERILLENRRLAQKYISVANKDSDFHEKCKTWHDLISIELMILFAPRGRISDLFDVIRKAIKQNWTWPFTVAAQSPLRIKNYLMKNYVARR